MIVFSMHLYNSDEGHAWFHLYGTSRPCQECIESEKMQNEKFLLTVGHEPTAMRSEVWCSTNWAYRALDVSCYI